MAKNMMLFLLVLAAMVVATMMNNVATAAVPSGPPMSMPGGPPLSTSSMPPMSPSNPAVPNGPPMSKMASIPPMSRTGVPTGPPKGTVMPRGALAKQQQQQNNDQCMATAQSLSACATSVATPSAGQPSNDCCSVLKVADVDCLCSIARATLQLPAQCGLPAITCSAN